MQKLDINLENCYGINKLKYEFDFSKCKTFSIYAPNGVMKTSFAKTFKDIVNGNKPCDQIDDSLMPVFNMVVDSTSNQIKPEEICVIEPYNEKSFDSEDKILALLANEDTKKKYIDIYEELNSAKKSLITPLKSVSKSTNCELEIITAFSNDPKIKKSIFEILVGIQDNINNSTENFDFKYNNIFDPEGKVKSFLLENYELFKEYYSKYEDLISHSDFFKKDGKSIFGTSEAKKIKDSIKGDEFFIAGHKLNLKKYGDINDQSGFTKILDEEINKIFNDDNLKKIFKTIDDKLDSNQKLNNFKKEIENDPSIIIFLNDYESFRKKVWFSYLKKLSDEVNELVELYKKKKPELEAIIKEANEQKSKWNDAIEEFHNRFVNMPFILSIDNQSDAVLGIEKPIISFKFKGKPISRKKLVDDVLSQGEKRAFYILNIIFEIRARETKNQETLFIIDDIADSFDYKNKYAIVEYLNDISKNSNFYSIILTHNYDFYRTITSRLGLLRDNKLHAIKTKDEIKIVQEVYQNPPFKTWRENMKSGKYHDKTYTNIDAKKHIIALIPFVRNLIEYSDSIDSSSVHGSDFDTLTNLLHSKNLTKNITFKDLKNIYKKHINNDDFDSTILDTDIIYNTIIDLANNIGDEEFNLENKILLSVAIRHKTEEFILLNITDKSPINGSQTGKLIQRYKDEFQSNIKHKDIIRIMESVNIMTPENIHLNSFMYEPILDMGIDELKSLYNKVCNLYV